MHQHVKDLRNSASQYFPSDQCIMLQNYAWVIKKFKVQNRPLDCNVIEYKTFTATVPDSTFDSTILLRNLHLSSSGVISNKIVHIYLKISF